MPFRYPAQGHAPQVPYVMTARHLLRILCERARAGSTGESLSLCISIFLKHRDPHSEPMRPDSAGTASIIR